MPSFTCKVRRACRAWLPAWPSASGPLGADRSFQAARSGTPRARLLGSDPPLVSYRHGVGYRRSPGNLAPRVTRSIGECRMSLWSTMVVSPQGLLDGRLAPERSLAVEHLSWPDHRVRTGSTAACNDLIHTWDNAGKQPLFRPAPHLPSPPRRPSRRRPRFRQCRQHLRLRESWVALAYAGVRSL